MRKITSKFKKPKPDGCQIFRSYFVEIHVAIALLVAVCKTMNTLIRW